MNNNFEIILNNNKEFINSIANIMSKIYSEYEFEKNINKINGKFKGFELDNKFRSFLKDKDLLHLFSYILLTENTVEKDKFNSELLNLKDNNGIFWVFSVNKDKTTLENVSTTFMNKMIALEHDKDLSIIYSQTSKLNLYIELNDNINAKEQVELNCLNYDINIESVFKYDINNFVFLDYKEFLSKVKLNQNKYKLNN